MRRFERAIIPAAAVAAVFVAVPRRPARAARRAPNTRLDRALHNPADKTVVAGYVASLGQFPPGQYVPPQPFVFRAEHVVLGDVKLEGSDIDFPRATVDWPSTLVPLRKDAQCILVLREKPRHDDKRRHDHGEYWIRSVVPRHGTQLPRVTSVPAAKRILAGEILAELREERSAGRQRKLIMQASPILTPTEAGVLLPFLKSKDAWLRRAAIAGLCHATKREEFLKLAMEDMKRYARTPPLDDEANGPEEYAGFSPWWYPFFEHYFFLSVGWSVEEDASATVYLPLFRQVLKEPHFEEWGQWRHGMRPLCWVGTREDIPALYRYLFVDGPSKVLKSSYSRQALLRGMARILEIEFANRAGVSFLAQEKEQRAKVLAALRDAGVIDGEPEKEGGTSARPGEATE